MQRGGRELKYSRKQEEMGFCDMLFFRWDDVSGCGMMRLLYFTFSDATIVTIGALASLLHPPQGPVVLQLKLEKRPSHKVTNVTIRSPARSLLASRGAGERLGTGDSCTPAAKRLCARARHGVRRREARPIAARAWAIRAVAARAWIARTWAVGAWSSTKTTWSSTKTTWVVPSSWVASSWVTTTTIPWGPVRSVSIRLRASVEAAPNLLQHIDAEQPPVQLGSCTDDGSRS
jgi:hypothetical protein